MSNEVVLSSARVEQTRSVDYAQTCDLGRIAFDGCQGHAFIDIHTGDPLEVVAVDNDPQETANRCAEVEERLTGMQLDFARVEELVSAEHPLIQQLLMKRRR